MATNQPLLQLNSLSAIETILTFVTPVVFPAQAIGATDQAGKWKAIKDRVAEWMPAADEPDDRTNEDGYRSPSRSAAALALEIAARLHEGGVAVPDLVVQDGNGGIDLEWRSGNRAQTLSVNSRGETELIEFDNSLLIARRPVSFLAA